MRRRYRDLLIAVITFVGSQSANAYTPNWLRQFGTPTRDFTSGVSADGLGNVYVAGQTDASLGGPHYGFTDGFLSKYSQAGSFVWSRQIGTNKTDICEAVSADSLGNIFVSGRTSGSLGGPIQGSQDAFVCKFDAMGNLAWMRQLGTQFNDSGLGVSADGLGNVYLSGTTFGNLGGPNAANADAFLAKYDASGNLAWARQLGTNGDDTGESISVDSLGNVFIAGRTGGSLYGTNAGQVDAFISKYDAAGNQKWVRQIGTSTDDFGWAVSADGLGNAYLSGYTGGGLDGPNAGDSQDAFVGKFDSEGNNLWKRQLGAPDWDEAFGVAADQFGNVYIGGDTEGMLGDSEFGFADAFVSKYDSDGNFRWTHQFGSSTADYGYGISTDGHGRVFITGGYGGADAFVASVTDVQGDYDGDADVDGADFLLWQQELGRVDNHFSHLRMAAKFQNAKKLRAVFSYRVAARRKCLTQPMNRSTRLRCL